MKQTASFSFTSIKSSQAYDTCRRQMTPFLLPINGIALLPIYRQLLPYNGQTTFCPTQTPDYNPHNLLL